MRQATTISPTVRRAIAAVVIACATLNASVLGWAVWTRPTLNSDFMAFWSYARFARTHRLAGIYDANAMQAFQQALYPGFHSFYPYLYPPSFLLAGWWLRFFSFGVAEAIWTVGGVALLSAAVWCFFRPGQRGAALAAVLAGPASLLNFMTGETAYFTTALLLFGFAALPKRPVLAGIAFGLLTLKPQLGVLVPVALLVRRDWQAILAASAVALGLAGISAVVFPARLWAVWAHTLPAYQAQYFASHGLNLNIIVTPMGNLVVLGTPASLAWSAQVIIALGTAAMVLLCFRSAPYRLAVACLLCGGFLAVPHAYAYDSIALTAAMALCLEAGKPVPGWLLGLGIAVYLMPFLLLSPAHAWFFYAVPEMLLFIAVFTLAMDKSNRAVITDEPDLLRPVAS